MLKENDVELMIKTIFLKIFEVPSGEITDQTRRGELERWDSLGHLVLLEALREEFRIEINPRRRSRWKRSKISSDWSPLW